VVDQVLEVDRARGKSGAWRMRLRAMYRLHLANHPFAHVLTFSNEPRARADPPVLQPLSRSALPILSSPIRRPRQPPPDPPLSILIRPHQPLALAGP
jgi:hypothetical protein